MKLEWDPPLVPNVPLLPTSEATSTMIVKLKLRPALLSRFPEGTYPNLLKEEDMKEENMKEENMKEESMKEENMEEENMEEENMEESGLDEYES
jgi:pentapeptide MXKDX repeat protein